MGDRRKGVVRIRGLANWARTIVKLDICNHWVRHGALVRCPLDVWFYSRRRRISMGNNVQFGRGCSVQCDVTLGSNILIAREVAFVGRDDHRIDLVGKTIWDSGPGDGSESVVEDDVWIGYGAIILSGVRVGRGSVVAAGSVVNKDVPRYSVVAGVPARVVKMRFTPDQVRAHEAVLGYSERDSPAV